MWILFMAMNGDPGDMQPLFDAYPGTLVFAARSSGMYKSTGMPKALYMIFTSFVRA